MMSPGDCTAGCTLGAVRWEAGELAERLACTGCDAGAGAGTVGSCDECTVDFSSARSGDFTAGDGSADAGSAGCTTAGARMTYKSDSSSPLSSGSELRRRIGAGLLIDDESIGNGCAS